MSVSPFYLTKSAFMLAAIVAVVIASWRKHSRFARFGPANQTTMVRAAIVAFVAGLIGETATTQTASAAALGGLLVAVLDGVDGWLARRTRSISAFGARFDMEIDALLILALSILVWQYGKAGVWIVASGLLRYAFVAAAWMWEWLERPLPASDRRRAICAIQTAALVIAIAPIVPASTGTAVAALSLAALCWSFAVDVWWLWRHRAAFPLSSTVDRVLSDPARGESEKTRPTSDTDLSLARVDRWSALVVAIVLLNASLTFGNLWPTPMIQWQRRLSIELAVSVLALTIARRWIGLPSRAVMRWLSAIWVLLVIGHYADVTAPALYGREVNLYWDLRFIPDVAGLFIKAASLRMIAAIVGALVLALTLLYVPIRWAVGRVGDAIGRRTERYVLTVGAAIVALLFVALELAPTAASATVFATPITQTYAHQGWLIAKGMKGSASVAPSPPMESDLSRVGGADVYLVFLESYGAVAYDRPELNERLTQTRRELDAAVRDTNREIVSAFVESPTFGGSSWLAHISLMSGVEVRGPDTNALLMAQKRPTLVTTFARHGYRTVALMPALWQRWPEGAFYGFDEIYGGKRLDYRGPPFGWFWMSDQFAIAKLDALESDRAGRQPLFVVFPTITTHAPFSPVPPYQKNWPKVLTDDPYDAEELRRAYLGYYDWLDLTPNYGDAVAYAYTWLAGYLRARADRDFILIVIGDHQPPALVSGTGASWDVPVHVIANRRLLLDRLRADGFRSGVVPTRPALGRMHMLLPLLLEAFGDAQAVAGS